MILGGFLYPHGDIQNTLIWYTKRNVRRNIAFYKDRKLL